MVLNDAGKIVQDVWEHLPYIYSNIRLDEMMIMPDHMHCIIVITDRIPVIQPCAGKGSKSTHIHQNVSTTQTSAGMKPGSVRHGLSEIVRGLKTFSSRRINKLRITTGIPVWQRNYYEHIIRDKHELTQIRNHIRANPRKFKTKTPKTRLSVTMKRQMDNIIAKNGYGNGFS